MSLLVFCQTRCLTPDPNTDHIWWMLMCDIWISNIHLGWLFYCLDCVALQWVIITLWCYNWMSNDFINHLKRFSSSSSMFLILILKHLSPLSICSLSSYILYYTCAWRCVTSGMLFQVLADTCMEIEDFNFEAGREKENKTKNQNPAILPRKSTLHKISCDRYVAQH